MTYRDEREALHNQVSALEEDLAEARRDAANRDEGVLREKAAALEAQVGTMRGELARMEAELAELRGPTKEPPSTKSPAKVVAFLGVGVMGMVVSLVLVSRGAAPPSPPVVAPIQAQPRAPGLDLTERMRKSAETPAPSAKPSSQVVAAEAPRATEARWIARVKRAEGTTLAVGSTCTLDATISSKGVNAVVDDLVLNCGGRTLYAKSDPLEGMAMMGNDARERLGPTDHESRFTLQYNDKGTRTGSRSQIEIDSNKGIGIVFSENLPPFKVELTLPLESQPATPLNGPAQRLSRTGVVDGVTGPAPVKAAEKCTIRAMPTGQQQSCVAEVKCGAKVLIATTAPVECTYHGSQIETVSGRGSPSLAVADDGTKLSVAGDHGYEVRIAYDHD